MQLPARCVPHLLLPVLAGCTATEPREPTVIPLEAVPFEQLGSGTVVFHRTWHGPINAPTKAHAVYSIDADARESRVTVIRVSHGSASRFAVSPDGAMLAYAVEQASDGPYAAASLVVSRIDGSKPVTVATLAGGPTSPRWTPDGQRIVYADYASVGYRIYSVPATATLSPSVTLFPGSAEPESCSRSAYFAQGPVSVSDAGDLLFACSPGEIYVLDSGATTARLLYTARETRFLRSALSAPTWSPDGHRFVFLEEVSRELGSGLVNEMLVFDIRSGTVTTLTTIPIGDESRLAAACWMADGQRIAYATYTPLGTKIHVIPANGGTPVRITSADSQDGYVSCTR